MNSDLLTKLAFTLVHEALQSTTASFLPHAMTHRRVFEMGGVIMQYLYWHVLGKRFNVVYDVNRTGKRKQMTVTEPVALKMINKQ